MLSELERKILKDLKTNDRKRRMFCTQIYQDLVWDGIDLPDSVIPALEYLLEHVNLRHPKRKGVIVSGSFIKEAHRHTKFTSNGTKRAQYVLVISGRTYYVRSINFKRGVLKMIYSEVEINLDHAVISGECQGKEYRRIIKPEKGVFIYDRLTQFYYERCVSVEIRQLDAHRRVSFACRKKRVSKDDRGSFVILVHDEGETYMYNLFGEMVFTSLSKQEVKKKQTLAKTLALKEESNGFNKEDYIGKVKDYLISRWREKPKDFEKEGRMILIEGSLDRRLDYDGRFLFEFFQGKKKKQVINVGTHYKKKDCHAEFIGPYVFLYCDRSLVNGHKTDHIGFECKRLRPVPNDMEYIRIKNIGPKQIYFYAGDKRYLFRLNDVFALMCHNTREGSNHFTLLIQTENGEVYQKEINPNICGSKYYKPRKK